MGKRIFYALIFLIFLKATGNAQVVSVTNPGNTTPALNATYASLQLALDDLNVITAISGPVTITLNTGNAQTAPAGGYVIHFTATTTAVNHVVIAGSGNIITAHHPQLSGSTIDAIFKIIGSDYVTISNFVMRENALNTISNLGTNNMTEWGIALLCRTTANGAQYNTLRDNVISLNKTYRNTFGIYSNTRHSFSSATVAQNVVNGSTAPNHGNKVYNNHISDVNMGITFVGAVNGNYMDRGNDIGGSSPADGNTIMNFGGQAISTSFVNVTGSCYGIFMNHQLDENIHYNTIESAVLQGSNISVRGIYKQYSGGMPLGIFTSSIKGNSIAMDNHFSGATFELIRVESTNASAVPGATILIQDNHLEGNEVAHASGPTFVGINNTFTCGTLEITGNVMSQNTSASSSGGFTGIQNTAAVPNSINISNNHLGEVSDDCITFSAATSGAIRGIYLSNAGSGAAVMINNNLFAGFNQTIAGTGGFTGIYFVNNTATSRVVDVNNNTFHGLQINNNGLVNIIHRTGVMQANAGSTENCTGNTVVNGLTSLGTGAFNIYYATGNSLMGNTMAHKNNNFSGLSGAATTTLYGWNNNCGTQASAPEMTFTGNTFSNWNFPQASTNVAAFLNPGNQSVFSNNLISDITCGAFTGLLLRSTANAVHGCSENEIRDIFTTGNIVYGIRYYGSQSSTVNIHSNIVRDFSMNSALLNSRLYGIYISPAETGHVYNNQVAELVGDASSISVSGIQIDGTANNNHSVYNNVIGHLQAPSAVSSVAVRGIAVPVVGVNSQFAIDFNTIYLNATSTGSTFGTTGIYLAGNATSTTGNATLRNNLVVNLSTPNGTGRTSAYMRSNAQFNNYNAASNNNLFYAGTPGTSNLIFYNIASSDQTLVDFQTRVGPVRESNSITELSDFLSLAGSSPQYLRLNPATPTQAESSGISIAGITDDVDGDIRFGNAGYAGTGTAPDIGADEIEGIYSEKDPPLIVYTPLASPTCTLSGYTLYNVSITDETGVPLAGLDVPRIYYRKNGGTWYSRQGVNVSGDAFNSLWNFTVQEADMGGLAGGDVVEYFVTAQDVSPAINVGANTNGAFSAVDVHQVLNYPIDAHTYVAGFVLTGNYSVGLGGDFATLTHAIDVYNTACALNGPVVFDLIDPLYTSPAETFPINILQHPDASAVNTLTIKASVGDTSLISGSASTYLIGFNGADHIIFDGSHGASPGARLLTVNNTGTGVAMQFFNDANNNVLDWCNVQSGRQGSFSGTIHFGVAASGGSGNRHNRISNCSVYASNVSPTNAIYSAGTAGSGNDSITIINNEIFDFYSATADNHGLYINSNSSHWTIENNKLYQTAPRRYTGVNIEVYGFRIASGSGHTISGNTIGFADALGNGSMDLIGNSVDLTGFPTSWLPVGSASTLRFLGIVGDFDSGGDASSIDGNVISGINIYSASAINPGIFNGMYIENGFVQIGVNQPNIIGSATEDASVYVAAAGPVGFATGIRVASADHSIISNNIMGGILCTGISNAQAVTFIGISRGGTGSGTIQNNTIGHSNSTNIRTGYCTTMGMLSSTGTMQAVTTALPHQVTGISATAHGQSLSITGNILQGWESSVNNSALTGIYTSGLNFSPVSTTIINDNELGTALQPLVLFSGQTNESIYGIRCERQSGEQEINGNHLRGFAYGQPGNYGGNCHLISTSGTIVLSSMSISNNQFANINSQQSNTIFIESGSTLTAGTSRNITGNTTTGAAVVQNAFTGIRLFANSAAGAQINVRDNNFTNINCESSSYGIFDTEGVDGTSAPAKRFSGNVFEDVECVNGDFTGIFSDKFGGSGSATDSIDNNSIQRITATGSLTGMDIRSLLPSQKVVVSNNVFSELTTTGSNQRLTGIRTNLPKGTQPASVFRNTVHTLSAQGASDTITGIHADNQSVSLDIEANKLYGLNAAGTSSSVTGILAGLPGSSSVDEVNIFNNLCGSLNAATSGDALHPTVTGVRLLNQAAGSLVKVYHNTVHLNATGGGASFTSAAVYSNTAGNVHIENNIFSNLSVPGAGGKTVAHWREAANYTGFTAATNVYYVGTPSATRLTYFDPANAIQSLPNYQTLVAPEEAGSVYETPQFTSTTGADADYLHLDSDNNCGILAIGSNDVLQTLADFDGDLRDLPPPSGSVCDPGADEVSKWNVWTGANGTVWNDPGNWSSGAVPDNNSYSVLINLPPPVPQPQIGIGELYPLHNLKVTNGSTLTQHGTVQISGTVRSDIGAINNMNGNDVLGSMAFTNGCVQTININGAWFNQNRINDLTLLNNAELSSLNGEGLWVHGALSFGASTGNTFETGDNLTIASGVNSTGRVAPLLGNTISGEVTVERYVNTGLATDGRHPKSWQLLSTPVSGPTVFSSWQENGLPTPGFGTILTGTGMGFDITTTLPSMKWYNSLLGVNGDWQGITNTGDLIHNVHGYMLFVRGDRTVTSHLADANPTILRMKGTLFTPAQPPPPVSVPAGRVASAGNPYASPISLVYMRDNNHFVGLDNNVVVWDPLLSGSYNLGGWQTLSELNDYEPTAGGTAYYPSGVSAEHIQSGQAFIVKSSGSPGSVTFSELCKSAAQRLVHRNNRQIMRIRLFTGAGNVADGVAAVFDNNLRKGLDENDARKMRNDGENLSIERDGESLSIEAWPLPQEFDTIHLAISHLRRAEYSLRFFPKNMRYHRVKAYIADRFLQTITELPEQDSFVYHFQVNDRAASYASNRFYVVFKRPQRGTIGETGLHRIQVMPNPVRAEAFTFSVEGLPSGRYGLYVYSNSGKEVYRSGIVVNHKNADEHFQHPLPANLSGGVYRMELRKGKVSATTSFVLYR